MTLLSESELREKLLSLRRPDQTDLVYGKTLEVFTDDLIQLITKYGDTREREGRESVERDHRCPRPVSRGNKTYGAGV